MLFSLIRTPGAAGQNLGAGAVDLGFSPAGTRIRKKVSGKTKVEVRDKLRELRKKVDVGLRPRQRYTVGDALDDWIEHGLDGRSERTVKLYPDTIATALKEKLGRARLTGLTAAGVYGALAEMAPGVDAHAADRAQRPGAGDPAC
jgi:hypothetical protein